MPDKESNLFDQLRSKQLVGVSKSNFSSATDQTFIEECNLDEFKLINVIGQATNMQSQSGPIPGTGKIVTTNVTDNTITSLYPDIEAGEVWAVNAIGAQRNGGSGDVIYNLYVTDGTTRFSWFYYKTDDSNPIFTGDANYQEFNMLLDENITLEAKAEGSGGGSFTSVDFYLNVYRVR